MRHLFPKFQRMPGLRGSICILLVLTGPLPGASGFTEDESRVSSFSEGTPPSCPTAATQWSTAFEQPDPVALVKGKLLTTIPALGKQWRVSFEVFPQNFKQKGLKSILHMVTGEKLGKFGKHIPSVWIHRSKGVVVSTALGMKPIFTKRFRSNVPALRNWTEIEVSQRLQGEDYIYAINIGGNQVFSSKNSRPRDFYDVRVFTASPSSSALAGSIRHLKIEIKEKTSSSMNEGISHQTLPKILYGG